MKTGKSLSYLSGIFCFLILFSACNQKTDNYTHGVGIYPGNPAEDFSPSLMTENENYRNLAKLRPAYNSSSYDYNLTAQLVTDGIIENQLPASIDVSTNLGSLPRNEREWLLDDNCLSVQVRMMVLNGKSWEKKKALACPGRRGRTPLQE